MPTISPILPLSPPEAVGHMVGLCALNGIYRHWTIEDIGRLFIPPVLAGQYRLYLDQGLCIAFATWAYLSDEWSERVRVRYDDPAPEVWRSGPHLWIVDMVAPGIAPRITRDLQRTVFKDRTEPGFALRRDANGVIRKIARWPVWNCCERA